MNPQHIVYLGIALVGLGVSICAIDPLKPLPEISTLSSNWFATGIQFNDDKCAYVKHKSHEHYVCPQIKWDVSSIPDSVVITGLSDSYQTEYRVSEWTSQKQDSVK